MTGKDETKKDKKLSPSLTDTKITDKNADKFKKVGKSFSPSRLTKRNKILIITAALLLIIVLTLATFLTLNQTPQQKAPITTKKQQKQKEQKKRQNKEDQPQTTPEEVGTPACPSGYKIDGDACTRTTRIAATVASSCPPGTDDIGRADACGTYAGEAQPYQECPTGTIFETEAHTKLYCFTKVRTNIESCGEVPWSGSFLDKKNHKCYYAAVEAHRLSRCPAGQVVHKNRCYQPKPKRVVYSCPAGYILDNRECVMVEKTDQKKLCPKDYTYDTENNKCLKK